MVIAIDFDGTCVTHDFPLIGNDIGAVPILKDLVAEGHQLILWTMRSDGQEEQMLDNGYKIHSGDFLTQAVKWFEQNEIPLYAVQRNPQQDSWTTSNKCWAHLYIDDAALGCPLVTPDMYKNKKLPPASDRPFVDWAAVRSMLIDKGILSRPAIKLRYK